MYINLAKNVLYPEFSFSNSTSDGDSRKFADKEQSYETIGYFGAAAEISR